MWSCIFLRIKTHGLSLSERHALKWNPIENRMCVSFIFIILPQYTQILKTRTLKENIDTFPSMLCRYANIVYVAERLEYSQISHRKALCINFPEYKFVITYSQRTRYAKYDTVAEYILLTAGCLILWNFLFSCDTVLYIPVFTER